MKKTLLLALIAMAAAFGMSARTLSPGEALQRAGADVKAPRSVRTAALASPRLMKTVKTVSGLPAAYLFDMGRNGFAVLAADDVAYPVLGYGYEPVTTGELPENLQWWLNEYAAQVEYASTHATGEKYVDYTAYRKNFQPIAPLMSTRWNQGSPYNGQCPVVSGSRSVTGCVATAMAQVMKYFNYPSSGTGTKNYVDSYGNSYAMNFGALDWRNMLDEYSEGSYTTTQANAVAYLMKSCGYSVEMNYSPNASGASSVNVRTALITYFGYDEGVSFEERSLYGLRQWEEMIYNNLRHVGPVYYSGQSQSVGHAFVCDGYDTDGYFHFNWGWGGMSDGYFLLTACNPNDLGTGGGTTTDGYSLYQGAMIGVRPPTGQSARLKPLRQWGDLSAEVSGTLLELSCKSFYNPNEATLNSCTGALFVNEAGEESYIMDNVYSEFQYLYGTDALSVDISSLPNGTYQVYPACRIAGYDECSRMIQEMANIRMAVLRVANGQYDVTLSAKADVEVTEVNLPSVLYAGRTWDITAEVVNNHSDEAYLHLGICLLPADGTMSIVATGGFAPVDLFPGQSSQIRFNTALDWGNSSPTPGDYYLAIYNIMTGKVYYYNPITLDEDPGAGVIACSGFGVDGNPYDVDASNLTFYADVNCTAGYYTEPFLIYLWRYDSLNNSYVYIGYHLYSDFVPMLAGDERDLLIKFNFTEGEIGETYHAQLHYLNADNSNWDHLGSVVFNVTRKLSGIDTVASDSGNGAPVEYYDLMGRKVTDPIRGHLYIRRQGSRVEKTLLQ